MSVDEILILGTETTPIEELPTMRMFLLHA